MPQIPSGFGKNRGILFFCGGQLQIAMDNEAKKVMIPIENKRNFFDVSADILENVDPIFYGDAKTAAFKALGV
jgi:ATP-dependent Lon protease